MSRSELDAAQLAAVTSPHKETLVVAGAGAGKTRVLTERIAYMIEVERAHPAEILAMTFTRKAANEMRERLIARLGNRGATVAIGTFHSMALRYIKMFGERLGLKSYNLSVYGPWEEAFLLKDIAKQVRHKGKITSVEEYYTTGMIPLAGDPELRLFAVFMDHLRRFNAVTYGQLMVGMLNLAKDIVGHQVKHVLIDEAQDLDALQWAILMRLQEFNPELSLFIVGDIDQSIYEWRGAEPQTLRGAAHLYQVYKLETNYRSDPAIVAAADRLIQFNNDRIPKRMVANRQTGELLPLVLATEIDSLAAGNLIQGLVKEGSSVAVLARTHVLLIKLSQILSSMGIEHHYCGRDSKIMQSEPFRRAHSILQLANNHYDDFSFLLARGILGIGEADYSNIRIKASDNGQSYLDAWLQYYASPEWVEFFATAQETSLFELLDKLDQLSDGADFDVAMPLKIAVELAQKGATLEEYLEWVATYDIQEEVKTDLDGVQLMTIHAAKGLEFPCVVLVGWNEGLLPSSQAGEDRLEEERRLAYVALTRARDRLFVTARPEATVGSNGKQYTNSISRFMAELK